MLDNQLTFRLTNADAANILAIANALRDGGNQFPTRTDACRFALELAAREVAKMKTSATTSAA